MSSQPTNIGIIGGGQLGGFLFTQKPPHEFNSQLKYHIYSPQTPIIPTKYPNSQNPSYTHFQGDYHDTQNIIEFGQSCDIITYELENISIEALEILQTQYHKKVYPDPQILKIIQNKKTQKQWLIDHKFPTSKFITSQPKFKCVQKLETGGYDGRGVKIITSQDEPPNQPYFLEEFIPIKKELSIIVGRNVNHDIFLYDPVETVPNPEHQLDYLICPAPHLSDQIKQQIKSIATRLAIELELVGIMAVEFFLSEKHNDLYINEISPRPHNTGHHTLDVYPVNQFELLNQCLLNLPLPNPVPPKSPTLMINIVGTTHIAKPTEFQPSSFYHPHFHIYSYNKSETFLGRKIGHLTYPLLDQSISTPEIAEFSSPSGSEEIQKIITRMKYAIRPPLSPLTIPPLVSIIMGSSSDLSIMQQAQEILQDFHIPHEIKVVSAHRTPIEMTEFSQQAQTRGIKVIIAGAGGAAHLPGMVASLTTLPVIGVPIKSSNSIHGIDSLLSICQMPAGIPVATMAVNGSKNAGLLAVRILATNDNGLQTLLEIYQQCLKEKVDQMNSQLKNI